MVESRKADIMEMKFRFDTREGCLPNCLDKIIEFHRGYLIPEETLYSVCHMWQAVEILEKFDLTIKIFSPFWFVLSRSWWRCSKRNIERLSKQDLILQYQGMKKCSLLSFGSAPTIYGLTELWLHNVCYLKDKNEEIYIDPFRQDYLEEYVEREEVILTPDQLINVNPVSMVIK